MHVEKSLDLFRTDIICTICGGLKLRSTKWLLSKAWKSSGDGAMVLLLLGVYSIFGLYSRIEVEEPLVRGHST